MQAPAGVEVTGGAGAYGGRELAAQHRPALLVVEFGAVEHQLRSRTEEFDAGDTSRDVHRTGQGGLTDRAVLVLTGEFDPAARIPGAAHPRDPPHRRVEQIEDVRSQIEQRTVFEPP